MTQPNSRAYWEDYYNDTAHFALLFKDFSTLREKAKDSQLSPEERAQFHVAELAIDGKLN